MQTSYHKSPEILQTQTQKKKTQLKIDETQRELEALKKEFQLQLKQNQSSKNQTNQLGDTFEILDNSVVQTVV